MTDTLHTNEERINKIRCLLKTFDMYSGALKDFKMYDTIVIDIAASEECLDAIEQFMVDHHTLDCI